MTHDLVVREHMGIIGKTRSGKSYLANELFKELGGLAVDLEDRGDFDYDIRYDKSDDEEQMFNDIEAGKSVLYAPSENEEVRNKELEALWEEWKDYEPEALFILDEAQAYKSKATDKFAVRGLKYGLHFMPVTQSPTNLSKTVRTQVTKWVYFPVSTYERQAFKIFGIPYEDVMETLNSVEDYHFVVHPQGEGISKPAKV